MFGRKAHVLSRMVLVLDTRDWNYYFRIDNPLNITQCMTRGLITQGRFASKKVHCIIRQYRIVISN